MKIHKTFKGKKKTKGNLKHRIDSSEDSDDIVPLAHLCDDEENDDLKNYDPCVVCGEFSLTEKCGSVAATVWIGYIRNVAEKILLKLMWFLRQLLTIDLK